MQELIDKLKANGLSEEQAIQAIDTIKGYIQSKLPPMMHDMVDNFLKTNDGDNDDISNMMKNFGA